MIRYGSGFFSDFFFRLACIIKLIILLLFLIFILGLFHCSSMEQLKMDGGGYTLFLSLTDGVDISGRSDHSSSCVCLCGFSLEGKDLWLQTRGYEVLLTFKTKKLASEAVSSLEMCLARAMHHLVFYGVASVSYVGSDMQRVDG